MKRALLLMLMMVSTVYADQWITVIVHGTVGLSANMTGRTLNQIKHGVIEGTRYERNVRKIRNHAYLKTLQPIGGLGLVPVSTTETCAHAAGLYSQLYAQLSKRFRDEHDTQFYTFGWSGLVSEKERYCAAHELYTSLQELHAAHPQAKLRLIAYSHGATLLFNLPALRGREYQEDTFMIDETIMLGMPVNKSVAAASQCAPFTKLYHIYSRGDKVQRLDVFTSTEIFSQRSFKNQALCNLKQIEFSYTAPLRCTPGKVLPSNMRGLVNQSPGHVEMWSFGWTTSMYRRNLDMYPICGAVLIPFLIEAANKLDAQHVKVDVRPTQERAFVQDACGCSRCWVPFMPEADYRAFLKQARLTSTCSEEQFQDFVRLKSTIDPDDFT